MITGYDVKQQHSYLNGATVLNTRNPWSVHSQDWVAFALKNRYKYGYTGVLEMLLILCDTLDLYICVIWDGKNYYYKNISFSD